MPAGLPCRSVKITVPGRDGQGNEASEGKVRFRASLPLALAHQDPATGLGTVNERVFG
jgi:hypothetical protein